MLSSDLANRVEQYLAHAIDLDELNQWLAERLPSYLQQAESDNAQLIGMIEIGLAEIDDDILNEAELRDELRAFLRDHPSVQVSFGLAEIPVEACIEIGSTNETLFPFGRRDASPVTTGWVGKVAYQVVLA